MNRRKFAQGGVAASVAMAVPTAAQAAIPNRMNMLYVFSDQHRACSVPGQPYSPVIAPTFAAFAKENFVVENCISNYPLCSPHRGILISGRWPQQTGVMRNSSDIALGEHEYGLGHAFKDAGYQTMYIGKWHLYYGEKRRAGCCVMVFAGNRGDTAPSKSPYCRFELSS